MRTASGCPPLARRALARRSSSTVVLTRTRDMPQVWHQYATRPPELLATLDEWAARAGIDAEVERPERFEPTRIPSSRSEINLVRDGIRTVVWATGYRPDHSWIDLPVFDRKGLIRHDGGVVRGAPDMYVVGL